MINGHATAGGNGHNRPMSEVRPCQRGGWCVLPEHDDSIACVEIARRVHAPPDYGPRRVSPKPTTAAQAEAVLVPEFGCVYTDDAGRRLQILRIDARDGGGRNVIGTLEGPSVSSRLREYACDAKTFEAIWRKS